MADVKSCYLPNGTIWTTHTPCNAQADQSHCCGTTDFCLDNGHCLQQTDVYTNRLARGSCTDQSWASSECPYECADVRTDSDTAFFLAYETFQGSFCCGENYNSTTQNCPVSTRPYGNAPFDLKTGRIIWNRTDGSIMDNGTLTAADIAKSQGQSSGSITTITVTATATPSGHSSSSNVGAVAAGIAVPLAGLLVAALVAVGILWSKLRKAKHSAAPATHQEETSQMQQASVVSQKTAPFASEHNGSMSPAPAYKPSPAQYSQPAYSEAPTHQPPAEADGSTVVHELGGRL